MVTYETTDEVGVRLNDGTGSFGAETRFPAGVRPRAIHAADLDGDTHSDLLIVNQGSSDLSVLHGDGSGSFRNVERVGTIRLPVMVSAGDLSGDGLPELAIASGEQAMAVHRNLGDGRFTRRDTYQAILEPTQYDAPPDEVFISADVNWHGSRVLIAADLDGANGPDIAASLSKDGTIGVFLNRGDGTLTGPYYTPVGAEPAAITSADFDRLDGPDLAVANEGGDTVSVLLNLGNGVFLTADQYPVGDEPRDLEAADLDGRNGPDLVVMNRGSKDISVLLNDGSGGFVQQALYPEPAAPLSRSFSRLVVMDLDRAAGPDLVLLRWERQGVWIYRNLGDGTFAPAEWLELPFWIEGRDMVTDDFDRDDWPDLVIRTSGELLTCLNRGGLLETSSRRRVGASYGSSMTTADMDGMSGPDIIAPGGILSMLFNDGGGDFVRDQDVFVGSDAFAATTADLDGDGGLEIVTADRYSGTMSVARSCPGEIDLLCNSEITSLDPVLPPFPDIFSPAGGLDPLNDLHQAGFPSGSYDPDPVTCSDAGGPLVLYQVTYPVPSLRVVRESDGRVRFFY